MEFAKCTLVAGKDEFIVPDENLFRCEQVEMGIFIIQCFVLFCFDMT